MRDRIGICCSGGGAAGASEAGMLKAFQPIRDRISCISGASIGSLNAAMFVQNDIAKLEELWKTINARKVYKKWKILLPFSYSFLAPKPLYKLIEENIDESKIQASHLRFFIQVTDRVEGHSIVREAATAYQLVELLKGSCAIPAIFPEIPYCNTFLVDGGIIDNTPMLPLIEAGCNKIYVLRCHPKKERKRKKLRRGEALSGLFSTLFLANQSLDTKIAADRGVEVIEIEPTVSIGTLDFDKKDTVRGFESGYETARRIINETLT